MTPGRIYTVGELLLKPHPVCDIFPLIEGDELRDLVADIEKNGVLEPIVVWGDVLIDGRNRWRACDILGKVPPVEEFEGDEADIVPWILSKNLHRRHLTTGQRAAIAAELAKLEQGQKKTGKFAGLPTQAEAAKLLKVSERSVRDARAVLDSGDEGLIGAMKSGEVAVSAAAKAVRLAPEPSSTSVELPPDPPAIKSDEEPAPLDFGTVLHTTHTYLRELADLRWARAAISAVRARVEAKLGQAISEEMWIRVVGAGQREGFWEHSGVILQGAIVEGDIWLKTPAAKALATQLEKAQRPEPPTMPADLDDPAAQGHLASLEEDPDDDEDEDDDDTDSDDDTADEDEETEGETSAPEQAPRAPGLPHGERAALDAYWTPDSHARALVRWLDERVLLSRGAPEFILEPSVGGGAWLRAARDQWPEAKLRAIDLDPTAPGLKLADEPSVGDFLQADLLGCDVVLGNPPYSAELPAWVDASRAVAPVVAYLLRETVTGSLERLPWWQDRPPAWIVKVLPRPRWEGPGARASTDTSDTVLVVWVHGEHDTRYRWLDVREGA